MIALTFFQRWVWPASGPGGIPGDVVATLIWVVIVALVTTVLYPPLRKGLESFVKRHVEHGNAELHEKLDHIIKHHPDIPPLVKRDETGKFKKKS